MERVNVGRAAEDLPQAGPSDEYLARAVIGGDLAALGQVFDRYARSVMVFAHRRCGDRSLAEDVTSTAFLEFWRSRERALVSGGSLLPWLLGITSNVLRSTERSSRRLSRALARMPGAARVPDHADAVVDLIHAEEQAARLRGVLTGLKTQDRDLLSLSLYGDLSMRQIAEVLDIPEGTVKSRLSRLRVRVAAELRASETGVPA